MKQSEIREHLNNFMILGQAYNIEDIHDHLQASISPTLKHRIRAALQQAKARGQIENIARSGWHTRVDYIQ